MNWNEVLSSVLQAVLIVLLPPLAVAGVRFIWAKAAQVWQKFENSKPDIAFIVEQAARFAVQAAEQAGLAGLIDDKKDYAIGVAMAWLETKNITVDLRLIEAAIEAAVIEAFPHPPEEPEPPADPDPETIDPQV